MNGLTLIFMTKMRMIAIVVAVVRKNTTLAGTITIIAKPTMWFQQL